MTELTDEYPVSTEVPPLRCEMHGKRIVHAHTDGEPCPRRVMLLYKDIRISHRMITESREGYVPFMERAATEDLVHNITKTLMAKPGARNWSGRVLRKERMDDVDFCKEVRFYAVLDSNDPFPVIA